jgi:hypothetical protein
MNKPIEPTPLPDRYGCDSLNVDIVAADDSGGTIVLPADPEAVARFLAERRQLERDSANRPEGPPPEDTSK